MTTFKQDPDTGDFLTLFEWEKKHGKAPKRPSPHKGLSQDIDAFVSPIDGSIISGRAALREHNKKHEVTNIADYEAGHFEKRGREMQAEARGATPEAKQERKELIDKTLTDFGV